MSIQTLFGFREPEKSERNMKNYAVLFLLTGSIISVQFGQYV